MYVLKWLPSCPESKSCSGLFMEYCQITERERCHSEDVKRDTVQQNKIRYALDFQANVISRED